MDSYCVVSQSTLTLVGSQRYGNSSFLQLLQLMVFNKGRLEITPNFFNISFQLVEMAAVSFVVLVNESLPFEAGWVYTSSGYQGFKAIET